MPRSKPRQPIAPPSRQVPRGPSDGQGDDPRAPLRPIGPDRLAELREAIRNGTYPRDEDVMGGLGRLLEVDLGDDE